MEIAWRTPYVKKIGWNSKTCWTDILQESCRLVTQGYEDRRNIFHWLTDWKGTAARHGLFYLELLFIESLFFFAHKPIKFELFLNLFIWPIDETRTRIKHENNRNAGVLPLPHFLNWSLCIKCRLISYQDTSFLVADEEFTNVQSLRFQRN